MNIKMTALISLALLLFSPIQARDKLKVSVPPSIWAQQSGKTLTGPIIELLERILSDLDISIAPEILPWARAIEYMKSGDLDMMPVIFYSQERARFMEFSIPYIKVPTAVFVPSGRSFPFNTLPDLQGRKGLMMRGDIISKDFERYKTNLMISNVTRYQQIFEMLDKHRADYAVAAQYGFLIEAKKLGAEHKFEMLPRPIALRNLHIAFSKKSPFLVYLPTVNKKLKQFQEDGTIAEMVKKAIRLAAEN
jgi:polar amino acid transport system substrate-binding protein